MVRVAVIRDVAIGLAAGAVLSLSVMPVMPTLFAAQGLSSVVITSPPHGATLSGRVVLTAIAGSADVEAIQFRVSGVNLGPEITSGSCTAAWNTDAGADGHYALTVVGRDSSGRLSSSQPVNVRVDNTGGGGGGGGGATDGPGRSRTIREPSKGVVTGGGDRGNRGGAAPAADKPGAPIPAPRCTTPDPFAKMPGLIGVCVDGGWVPVKR
jgi:hypothetical protein